MRKYVVLADDDQDDIEFFMSAMGDQCRDAMISVALNGKELFELLHKNATPDLIVLDMNMPAMSGLECLEQIREDHAYDSVPVLILSTSGKESEKKKCMAKGATAYYVKPHSFAELKNVVKHICDLHLCA